MNLETLVKKMLHSYLIIYACSMLCTLVFCLIFEPNATFPVSYFAWMMLFSLLGDLPTLVLYSRRTLSSKELYVRIVLHIILLEAVLLTFAYFLGLYSTLLELIAFALLILVVYIIVRLFCFSFDLKVANQINKRLKELKK